jgi:hypothetical protein
MMQVPVPQQRSSSSFCMERIFAELLFLPVVKGLGCIARYAQTDFGSETIKLLERVT